MMKLIVGLGNPGKPYENTRHNVGRAVVESLAGKNFEIKKSLKAKISRVKWEGVDAVLALPETFMNLSGEAVVLLSRHFKIKKPDILIVIDEVALPFGKLRLRGKGSDGGHNGLKSVAAGLGSTDYPRLRVGVGNPELSAEILKDFVLGEWNKEESRNLPSVLERAGQACRIWTVQPLAKAMNAIN